MSNYWDKKQKELNRAWGIFYSKLRKKGLNPAKEMREVGQRKPLYPYYPVKQGKSGTRRSKP